MTTDEAIQYIVKRRWSLNVYRPDNRPTHVVVQVHDGKPYPGRRGWQKLVLLNDALKPAVVGSGPIGKAINECMAKVAAIVDEDIREDHRAQRRARG